MREPVLLALVHIFAILSNVNPGGITSRGRRILHGYFKRYLNAELEQEYFKLFESNLKFYSEELTSLGDGGLEDESSIINFQIINICRQIRKGLFLEERMIVFLQLLEFVFEDSEVTDHERRIIDIVADTFSIPKKEYDNAHAFMLGNKFDSVTPDCIMLVEGCDHAGSITEPFNNRNKWHSLVVKGLKGSLFVLHIESINALIFTYSGSQPLFFRGRTVVKNRPYLLESGVSIKARDIEPIYYSGILRQFFRNKYSERIVFEGHDLEFRFKKSDQGIKPMSFRVDSGNMIGIMGGSGVGKSTLLNIMNGKVEPDSGNIYLNGYNILTEIDEIKSLIGYIPQDDLLIEELTVFQNLYYNARLCFGSCPDEKIKERARTVLRNLELEEISDLQVGDPLNKKISGGQRKRLNIGLELIREPAILFVDEPTSGLSSHDSWKVIELLKRQTRKGKLVFSIIHQPSSDILKLFDRLWIIDKGGHMVYDGDPVDSIIYFKTETSQVNSAESECPNCGNVETEDILQLIETKEVTEEGYQGSERQVEPVEWYKRYKDTMMPKLTEEPPKISLPVNQFRVPDKVSQYVTFFRRNLLRKFADRQYMIINLIESPLLAFILAYLSKYSNNGSYIFSDNKNIPVFLFMSVVVAIFLGLTVSAEEIFKDRNILERQKYLDISRASYLGSKIAFLFMLSALQTLIFVIIGNLILGIDGMLWRFWLILFSVSCFGNMFGLNISAGMKSVVSIYILIPLILVPQLLLGGAMMKYDDLHETITNKVYVPVVGDLMVVKWAYEAMTVEQFKSNNYEKLFYEMDLTASQNDWYASFLIPDLMKKSSESLFAVGKLEFSENSENNVDKIKRYSTKLSVMSGIELPLEFSKLNSIEYDTTTNAVIQYYLDSLKQFFRSASNSAIAEKDAVVIKLEQEYSRDYIVDLRNRNHNEVLSDIVLNNNSLEKIYENKTMILQKAHPVFMMPDSRIGRSHMFAPYKRIGNLLVGTLLFNISVIWLMTIFLGVTLYYNTLKRIISFFGKRHFQKTS